MSVTYDGAIIRKYAQKLYNQANLLIFLLLLLGVVGGLVVGAAIGRGEAREATWIGAALGGLLGAALGAALAFKYKLQAQMALCQAQIEENTRRAAGGT